MHSFQDDQGFSWQIAINIHAIKRVKDVLSIDLLWIDEPHDGKEGSEPLLTRLSIDLILLVDVIFVLVKPQADRHNITDEQFGARLGGKAFHAAFEAFWQELIDFFRQAAMTDRAAKAQKNLAFLRAATSQVTQAVEAMDVDETAASILGDLSTKLRESLVSIPGP